MQALRRVTAVAALVSSALTAGALGACASSGSFPTTGDPNASLHTAERAVSDAQAAGADSLAADVMTEARQNLASAQEYMKNGKTDHAAIRARVATADATYARAAAQRASAERERAAAEAALNAVGGNP
jgi:hypothetical protein